MNRGLTQYQTSSATSPIPAKVGVATMLVQSRAMDPKVLAAKSRSLLAVGSAVAAMAEAPATATSWLPKSNKTGPDPAVTCVMIIVPNALNTAPTVRRVAMPVNHSGLSHVSLLANTTDGTHPSTRPLQAPRYAACAVLENASDITIEADTPATNTHAAVPPRKVSLKEISIGYRNHELSGVEQSSSEGGADGTLRPIQDVPTNA